MRITRSQGTGTDANLARRTALFGLPAAGANVLRRFRSAFGRNRSSGDERDVEDRIRKVEAELEEVRRIDGGAPPRVAP